MPEAPGQEARTDISLNEEGLSATKQKRVAKLGKIITVIFSAYKKVTVLSEALFFCKATMC